MTSGSFVLKGVAANPTSAGVEIVVRELPEIGYRVALVTVEHCGVCHTELHVAPGNFGTVPGLILGHEGFGIVEQLGDRLTSQKAGVRVSIA